MDAVMTVVVVEGLILGTGKVVEVEGWQRVRSGAGCPVGAENCWNVC